MKYRLIIIIIALCIFSINLKAQEKETLSLSVAEAQDYAINNNKSILNAQNDVESAKYDKWSTISSGLPQVNLSGTFADYLDIATQLLPAEIFGGTAGTYMEVQFGTQYSVGFGGTVSQLLFNAPYLVGIKTVKLYESMSKQTLEKNILDMKNNISQTYFTCLLTEKSLKSINKNVTNMEETYRQTENMYNAGMAEKTDVDQLAVSLNTLKNSKKTLERTVEISYNLLRFQLGVDMNTEINLKNTLENLIDIINADLLLSEHLDLSKNIDYQLMQAQVEMAEISVQSEKAACLPSLSAYYSYTYSGLGNELNDLSWNPTSLIGLQLEIPIIAGGGRYSKIQKSKNQFGNS